MRLKISKISLYEAYKICDDHNNQCFGSCPLESSDGHCFLDEIAKKDSLYVPKLKDVLKVLTPPITINFNNPLLGEKQTITLKTRKIDNHHLTWLNRNVVSIRADKMLEVEIK